MLTLKEMRASKVDELKNSLEEARKSLANMKYQHSLGKLKNVSALKEQRKLIARILTVLKEKEILKNG